MLHQLVVPFSRLTRPYDDLSPELRDRPLLLLFRFVRFRTCFMTAGTGTDHRHFIETPLEVFLVGQVVAYFAIDRITFSTSAGAPLRPVSRYVCVIAVRQPASDTAVHVVLPCDRAWASLITRDEFVVGWCHGVPAATQPARRRARFRSRWSEFLITSASDQADSEVQRMLRDTFVPTGSDTIVDFSSTPISMVSEFGRVISVVPLQYARTYIGPSRPSTRVDEGEDSDDETPADILATGFSRGRPLPHGLPDIQCLVTVPALAHPVPGRWCIGGDTTRATASAPTSTPLNNPVGGLSQVETVTSTSRSSMGDSTTSTPAPATGTEPLRPTGDPMMVTLMALVQSTQQIATATQQLLLRGESQPQRPVPPAIDPAVPDPAQSLARRAASPADSNAVTSRSQLHLSETDQHRGRSRRPGTDQRGSSHTRRHHRSRSHGRQPSRSRSPRHQRERGRSRQRSHGRSSSSQLPQHVRQAARSQERSRSRSRGPPAQRVPGYNDYHERPARAQGPAFARDSYRDGPVSRRSQGDNDHDRSPPPIHRRHRSRSSSRGRCLETSFRYDTERRHRGRDQRRRSPSPSAHEILQRTIDELMAGATSFRPPATDLQVHQVACVGPRPNGTYSERALHSFWKLSLLDRVSAIQHHESLRNRYRVTKVTAKMLFSVNFGTRQLDHFLPPPAQSGGGRSVTHDPSTWSSADTSPVHFISTMEDLRATLYCIQEAAREWYPRPVAEVFRAVHADSLSHLLDRAPQGLVFATINLYTHVFSCLFQEIRDEQPAADLLDHAQAILSPNSDDYRRLVRHVIDQALIDTWARHQHPTHADRPRSERRPRRDQHSQRQPQGTTSGSIPATIKAQVPLHNGKPVCLRFQTRKDCTFPTCHNEHVLVALSAEVSTFLTAKHGDLKSDHPNLRA